jgi:trehalose 6-phosphate synthase
MPELVALYRAADVMLVTPVRDGMNLVAKEYVASRVDERGVLVLSELTGAAHELRSALQVNPYDVDGLKDIIVQALELPEGDQARRMVSLRRVVERHHVHAWADAFLEGLSA